MSWTDPVNEHRDQVPLYTEDAVMDKMLAMVTTRLPDADKWGVERTEILKRSLSASEHECAQAKGKAVNFDFMWKRDLEREKAVRARKGVRREIEPMPEKGTTPGYWALRPGSPYTMKPNKIMETLYVAPVEVGRAPERVQV